MSYIFLLEQGEESSAECFSDIPAYALSNGTSTPANAFSPANGTDACPASQSGTTCRPSTGNLGAGASMSSAGASPAKTSAQLEKARESTGSGLECGTTWPESLAKYDPATSSWRTRQCLQIEDSTKSSVTWPRWGMMRNGECWERATPPLRTRESVSGCLLPTPLANDSTGGLGNYMSLRKWWFNLGLGKAPSTRQPAFWEWMMGWPIGWTACDAAATDKFRQWQHSHSSSFPLVLANTVHQPTPAE
jgi:hypothetical protein